MIHSRLYVADHDNFEQGSNILSTLLALPSKPTIHTLARRDLPATSENLTPHLEKDSEKWPDTLATISPQPNVLLSALGTTRGQAGSFEAQRKVDYDLNLTLAKTAHERGVRVYVLISSSGASKSSAFPYMKMKEELEEAVVNIGFPHCVILRPGVLVGERKDSRPPEAMIRGLAKGLGMLSGGRLKDFWAQDADVVARAAVAAGMRCLEGKKEEGVWRVDQSEIIELGRAESTEKI